jgi:hypothetical protein
MTVKVLSANSVEVSTRFGEVLYSYKTPVAISFKDSYVLPNGTTLVGVYRTAEKYSKTTSKHINQWTATTKFLDQDVIDEIVRSV